MNKISTSILFSFLISFGAVAQSPAPSTRSKNHDRTIVVQEGQGNIIQPKVFVESGSTELSGSPEEGVKPAYRTWEHRCDEWKANLKKDNGTNLMVAECGAPTRTQESLQSEKWYTYKSKGSYKIRVSSGK
ncbi:MAG: hypothetical protein JWQ35_2516 [Bacteriovoracaceae bacterium]|nr:hypothetical protein [Bacteriovoracaceae bacterium]